MGLTRSMSRKGNPPYDNARMECFYKTPKNEVVDLQDYFDRLIGRLYSRERLHSSLGYVPPVEFAAHCHLAQKRLACWSCVMGSFQAPPFCVCFASHARSAPTFQTVESRQNTNEKSPA